VGKALGQRGIRTECQQSFCHAGEVALRSRLGLISEEVRVTSLAGAWLAGEDDGEGSGRGFACFGGGGAGGETLERGLDRSEVVEGIEAVGSAAEFSWGLGAAEHEETEDSSLVAAEVEDSADAVLILRDARVVDGRDEG
jgi:hypothetical protein